jgi:hypothetical protein
MALSLKAAEAVAALAVEQATARFGRPICVAVRVRS